MGESDDKSFAGERPGRKKEKTKQNTPQSCSVSSFRPLLWITSRDLSSYVLLKVNEKNCARTRVKFTLKAAFLGKRKENDRGMEKKEKSHRECERITWTSTNIPFWLRVQIPCRYLSNDLCMFFIFLHGVIMKLQRLRTREHAAHCTSVDQKERKKQQKTEIELQQHAAQHMHRNYSNAQGKFESKSVYLHTVFLYQYACQHFVQPIPWPAIGTITNETGFVPQGSR